VAVKDITKNPPLDTYDICIIGSGPAGLTLAKELADSGKRIAVLESGQISKTEYADALREVRNAGEISVRVSSRERVLGGASTTWSGLSAPLDVVDTKYRSYLSHPSGWPIGLSDLKPYYERAEGYGFAPLPFFDHSWLSQMRAEGDFVIPENKLMEKTFIALDPPWNFGKKLHHIFDNNNIDLYLNSTVIDLSSKKNGTKTNVTVANIKTSDGFTCGISANIFVLATGGLENCRLLLLSKSANSYSLGNEHDQVGRYLMNHPKGNYGLLHLKKPIKSLPHIFGYLKDGFAVSAGLRLSDETQRSFKVLNSYFRLEPVFSWTDNAGVTALITMTKKTKHFLSWWKRRQKQRVDLRDWGETGDDRNEEKIYSKKFNWILGILAIVTNMSAVFAYTLHRLNNKKTLWVKTLRLRNFMEMEPLPNNRLTLSEESDQNGIALPMVTLNTSGLDRRSLIELHKIFAEEMEKNGIGTLESNLGKASPWPIVSEASHHLGGTIMGNDPLTSVVNSDLQVHSVENLYVCGGSVFPTSGCANPTYTICALAIRLADHLKAK
jgi:choline dehydrogenase-like flavoprotein